MAVFERPYISSDYPFLNEEREALAQYLVTETNKTFENVEPSGIIKTYRSWNDLYIPIIDFPVLKIYSLNEDTITPRTPATKDTYNISYIMSHALNYRVPDVTGFVCKEILRNIFNGNTLDYFAIDESQPIGIEYDTTIDSKNQIKRYGTITCTIFAGLNIQC